MKRARVNHVRQVAAVVVVAAVMVVAATAVVAVKSATAVAAAVTVVDVAMAAETSGAGVKHRAIAHPSLEGEIVARAIRPCDEVFPQAREAHASADVPARLAPGPAASLSRIAASAPGGTRSSDAGSDSGALCRFEGALC